MLSHTILVAFQNVRIFIYICVCVCVCMYLHVVQKYESLGLRLDTQKLENFDSLERRNNSR